MKTLFSPPYVIVALDMASAEAVHDFVGKLNPTQCRLKIGKELFTSSGPELVKELKRLGFSVFLDLKYHDIPNQVAQACMAATQLGVWMLTVHALGGSAMLKAAREAIDKNIHKPLLMAVTLLTSMTVADCQALGLSGSAEEIVLRLAKLAADNGADGVVCSAQEASFLRKVFGSQFCLVTPGIRLMKIAGIDDQQRIMTPQAAVSAGVDYLVIGRPIIGAEQPLKILVDINTELLKKSC